MSAGVESLVDLSMDTWEVVACPSGTDTEWVAARHFHVVWLPSVRAGAHPALRSRLVICRVGASLITVRG